MCADDAKEGKRKQKGHFLTRPGNEGGVPQTCLGKKGKGFSGGGGKGPLKSEKRKKKKVGALPTWVRTAEIITKVDRGTWEKDLSGQYC